MPIDANDDDNDGDDDYHDKGEDDREGGDDSDDNDDNGMVMVMKMMMTTTIPTCHRLPSRTCDPPEDCSSCMEARPPLRPRTRSRYHAP